MSREKEIPVRFTVRSSPDRFRKIGILAAAFGIFTAGSFRFFGVPAGWILLGVSVAAVSLIAIELGKFGWYYRIDGSALTVHRTFRSYRINGSSIRKVTVEGWPGVRRAIDRATADASSAPGGGNRQVAIGRLLGFSAVPIPVRGPLPATRDLFVLIERHQGRVSILSPEDPRGFADALRRLQSASRD
jgi:hypothetical protein